MMERADAVQRLLAALYDAVGVTGTVCGGYVRDSLLGRPIRDIDLYVERDGYDDTCRHLFGDDFDIELEDEETLEYCHQSIARQQEHDVSHELIKMFGLPVGLVNVIGVTCEPRAFEVTSKYNLGLSKAGIDVRGLYVHPDFRRDADDEQITLLRTDWGYEHSMKQFIKLQAKYPWPLRIRKETLECLSSL